MLIQSADKKEFALQTVGADLPLETPKNVAVAALYA
jgi:hypothetical protein